MAQQQLPPPVTQIVKEAGDVKIHTFISPDMFLANATLYLEEAVVNPSTSASRRMTPSFIWDAPHGAQRSTYPPAWRGPLFHAAPRGTHGPAYLVFQPVGFTEMSTSLPASVGSYSTFSSFPRPFERGSLPFCGTFRGTAVTSHAPSR